MLDYIKQALEFNWGIVIIGTILAVLIFKGLCELWDWFFERFGIETKSMRDKKESKDRLKKTTELAEQTAKNLATLQESYTKDEEKFRKSLERHMTESEKDRKGMHQEMKQYSQNRIADRQQSIQIQTELKDSIKAISVSNIENNRQITSLIFAQKEMLAEKINEKYKYYLSIGGVPEDERDEFISLHDAYKGVGGNHNGDAKFEYCINHLPIIPVETKLIFENEE